ncbi:MAG: hypothetical protein K0R17_2246 [Rariglobus sp.]|jgi:hypothetical protein|nr:hypothetical protein [Rariglobus sp.]
MKITVTDSPYISLEENVAGALTGKDDLLLSLSNTGKAVLYTGAAPAVAVMIGKNSPDDTVVRARLLGKGGTVRMIQSAAIVPGSLVKGVAASARVATADAGAKAVGYKLSPGNGAAGDVIEVIDIAERTAVPAVYALQSTNGTAGAASANLAGLAAEAEKIGDDVRAIYALLLAAGLVVAA